MKLHLKIFGIAPFLIVLSAGAYSQSGEPVSPLPDASPSPSGITVTLKNNIRNMSDGETVSREAREQAYAKLLEGQRHLWKIRRSGFETTKKTEEGLSRAALQKAVELDPKLAEGYTALAELALVGTASNIDDAILLSEIAVSLDPDNFGAHRFLGRLFTIKSNLGRGNLNASIAEKAIGEWIEIGRLDPRNAEAWAFLSALYEATGKKANRIESLRNWLASAAPVETSFYANIMKNDGALSPESASIKLGSALLDAGKAGEALEILTRAVADNPGNAEAVELLGLSLENVDEKSLPMAIAALRQAVFADPDNQSLVQLLAETIAKGGEIDSAVRVLQDAIDKSVEKNKYSASKYQLAIGDLFANSDRTDEAIDAYRKALAMRGIKKDGSIAVDDKDFAIRVINKMVNALRKANRGAEAERLLHDSRSLFGKNNIEIDKQQVDFLVEIGKKQEALRLVRLARTRSPEEVGLLRREASILTSLSRVEEGTDLIKDLINKKPAKTGFSVLHDDFSNYLFLSSLYTAAKLKTSAVEYINKAIEHAGNKENRQIAKLNLAYLQQVFGEFESAEKNLREILVETPGYPVALNNLGYLLIKQDRNLEEALNLIKTAVRIEPHNSSYLDSLGWAYFKLERLDEAELFLRKAFRFNSTSSVILEHLGDVYRKRGKINEAKEVWEKALMFASNTVDTNRIRMKLTD